MIETLFGANSIAATLRILTPILFVGIGAAISLKAGVFNIAVEGFMLLSAFVGVVVSSISGSWVIGFLVSIAISFLLSLIYGFIVIKLKADQIITGLGLNIVVSGITAWFLDDIFMSPGGYSQPGTPILPTVSGLHVWDKLPFLANIFESQNVIFYLSLIITLIFHIFLHKSKFGLRLMATGENPIATRTVGVNPIFWQFAAIGLTGILCGLGGATLSMGHLRMFTKDMTDGRGYIAFVAASFARGNVPGTFLMSFVFALFSSISIRLEGFGIPSRYLQMIPYLVTIFALIIDQRRLNNNAS